MWLANLSQRFFGVGAHAPVSGVAPGLDPVAVVGPEPTCPVDWSELWERGELIHRSTGSICPFLGPVHLRAFEADVEKRKTQKYLLAQATPLDGRRLPSVFILGVPRPKHVEAFVRASKGVLGGTPGRRLLGTIGLLHANRTRLGWRVDYVQSHYNNSSTSPLKRSIATEYAGWTNRAMQTLADHVYNEGTRIATYGVTWVRRDGALVPQNTLSVGHFIAAFRLRGFHVVHLGGSTHAGPFHRSTVVAIRLFSSRRSNIGIGCVSMLGAGAIEFGRTNEAESIATIHRAIELGITLL